MPRHGRAALLDLKSLTAQCYRRPCLGRAPWPRAWRESSSPSWGGGGAHSLGGKGERVSSSPGLQTKVGSTEETLKLISVTLLGLISEVGVLLL